eukprot:3896458-Prorocentrum_lima.AAC.1
MLMAARVSPLCSCICQSGLTKDIAQSVVQSPPLKHPLSDAIAWRRTLKACLDGAWSSSSLTPWAFIERSGRPMETMRLRS